MKITFNAPKKTKNETTLLEWKEHTCYSTQGEAKQKSIRLEMFTGRPTKIVKDERTKAYWIMIGYNPSINKINKSLGDYNDNKN
jgi:hypothetical protein